MGRYEELGTFTRLTYPLHKKLQGLGVEPVVDLLDTGQGRWAGIVQEREEPQEPDGSVRGVRQLGGHPKSVFVENHDDLTCRTRGKIEIDTLEMGKHFPRVVRQAFPRFRIVFLSVIRKSARFEASSKSTVPESACDGYREGNRAESTSTSNTRNAASPSAKAATSLPPASSLNRGRVDRPLLKRCRPMEWVTDSSSSLLRVSTTCAFSPWMVIRRPRPLVRLNWKLSFRERVSPPSLRRLAIWSAYSSGALGLLCLVHVALRRTRMLEGDLLPPRNVVLSKPPRAASAGSMSVWMMAARNLKTSSRLLFPAPLAPPSTLRCPRGTLTWRRLRKFSTSSSSKRLCIALSVPWLSCFSQ